MALIKCGKCGKEISSNAEKCIHCGTAIDKTQKEIVCIDYETEMTIEKLNKIADISKSLCLIGGILLIVFAFIMLVSIEEINGSLISLFVFGVFSIVMAYVQPIFIKHKAMILKNLYEINKKDGV